jgi:hypothetical protein
MHLVFYWAIVGLIVLAAFPLMPLPRIIRSIASRSWCRSLRAGGPI